MAPQKHRRSCSPATKDNIPSTKDNSLDDPFTENPGDRRKSDHRDQQQTRDKGGETKKTARQPKEKRCSDPAPSLTQPQQDRPPTTPQSKSEPTVRKPNPPLGPREIDEKIAHFLRNPPPLAVTYKKLGSVYVAPAVHSSTKEWLIKVGSSTGPTCERVQDLHHKCDVAFLQRLPDSVFPELPTYYEFVEKLVHKELEGSKFNFPKCKCGTESHREYFKVEEVVANRAVRRWTRFIQQNPYDFTITRQPDETIAYVNATLKPEWSERLSQRKLAGVDETVKDHDLRGARWDMFTQLPKPAEQLSDDVDRLIGFMALHGWQLWSMFLSVWLCRYCYGSSSLGFGFLTFASLLIHLQGGRVRAVELAGKQLRRFLIKRLESSDPLDLDMPLDGKTAVPDVAASHNEEGDGSRPYDDTSNSSSSAANGDQRHDIVPRIAEGLLPSDGGERITIPGEFGVDEEEREDSNGYEDHGDNYSYGSYGGYENYESNGNDEEDVENELIRDTDSGLGSSPMRAPGD